MVFAKQSLKNQGWYLTTVFFPILVCHSNGVQGVYLSKNVFQQAVTKTQPLLVLIPLECSTLHPASEYGYVFFQIKECSPSKLFEVSHVHKS